MKSHCQLLMISLIGLILQTSLNAQVLKGFNETNDMLLVEKIMRVVPKYTGSNQLELKTVDLSRNNYSKVVEGIAELTGLSEIKYRAIFNSVDTLINFQINFPLAQQIKPSSLNALDFSAFDWTKFYLPSFVKERLVVDSCDLKFPSSGLGIASYHYGFKVLEDWQIFSGVDLKFSKIAIGFTINNPDSEEKDKKDEDEKQANDGKKKAKHVSVSGLMTAYFKWRDKTEVSVASNLVTDIKDWTITGELRSLTLDDVLATFSVEEMAGAFVPPVILQQGINKATIDIKPFKGIELTALTTLGNLNLMVERVTVDKKPLSTMLTGGYNPKPPFNKPAISTTSTMMTGGYSSTSNTGTSVTHASNTNINKSVEIDPKVSATESKGHKWGMMAGFSLPENFSFAQFIPELNVLDKFQIYNAAFYFSTFEAAPQNSLPAFKLLGAGNPTIYKGITFLLGINTEEINLGKTLGSLTDLTGVSFLTFSANIPANPAELMLNAGLNTAENFNIANRIYFPYMEMSLEPDGSGGRKFGLLGLMDLKIDNKTTLNFRAKGNIDPAKYTVNLTGAMVNDWNNAFGIKGFSFGGLEIGAGINFSYTPIPLPDNVSLAGRLGFGKISGKARIGLDINEPNRSHFVGELNNVSWNNLIDYLFEEQVKVKIPKYLKPYFDSELEQALIKFVPPGVGTIRTLTDEVLTPGFRIAGKGEIAGWGGQFDLALEGYEGGMNAGLSAYCKADPINFSAGNFTIFKLTGSDNRGKPEMKVDLTAGSLLKALSAIPMAANSNDKPVTTATSNKAIVRSGLAYYIVASHSNKVLDIAGGSKELQGKVHQWSLNRTEAQQFIFEDNGDGYYSIKNVNSGMYLDVQNGIAANGQPIWQYIGNKSPAQLFKLKPQANGNVEIESKLNSNLIFDIFYASKADGGELKIGNRVSGAPNQQFKLVLVNENDQNNNIVSAHTSYFIVASHSNKVLDIAGGSKELQGKVHQWSLNRSGAQQFVFEDNGDGYYSIKNVNSGMYLDVQNGIAANGQPIWQYIGNKSPAQLFKLKPQANGNVEIESKLNSNLIFDIFYASKADGGELKIGNRVSGAPNQQFKLVPVNDQNSPQIKKTSRPNDDLLSENSFVFVNGGITILGATNANALINLTSKGFVCQMDGKVYGFLDAVVDARIKEFTNPLKNTYVYVEADQKAYDIITNAVGDAVKDMFGSNYIKPFFEKGFTIDRIYFEGELDGLKSGTEASVDFKVAGKSESVRVNISVGSATKFAENVAKKIVENILPVFAEIKKEFENAAKLAKETADKAAAETKAAAERAAKETAEKARLAKEAADKAAAETKAAAERAAHETAEKARLAKEAADKAAAEAKAAAERAAHETAEKARLAKEATENAAREFASFSKNSVQKIWGKTWNEVTDFANDFKNFFDGSSDRKRIKSDGPLYSITTKYGNYILQSEPIEKDERHIYAGISRDRMEDYWQVVPTEEEGFCYIVSAFSGLNFNVDDHKKVDGARVRLMKHKKSNRNNERIKLIPVEGQPWWYYLQFEHSGKYAALDGVPGNSINNIQPGVPFFIIARHSGKAMEIDGGKKDERVNVRQYEMNRSVSQQFVLENASNGAYFIKNLNSNKYLSVADGKGVPGQNVYQLSKNGRSEQQFRIVATDAGYYKIVSVLNSQLNLDVDNASMDAKANIKLWSNNGNHAQQFFFLPVNRPKIHQMSSMNNSSLFKIEPVGRKTW